jgi:hypothetical protein
MFVLGLLVNEGSAARLRRVRQAWHRAETGQGEVWWQLYVVHHAPEDAQNKDPMQGWL